MGVSPRRTRLQGQSIIEYVLIIAIIGLVIVFAGPGVAGAIRNQFNLVGNTVSNGTTGGVEGGATGGGSAGAAFRDRAGGGGQGREGLDTRRAEGRGRGYCGEG